MKPTFRKQYGSRRELDRVLISGGRDWGWNRIDRDEFRPFPPRFHRDIDFQRQFAAAMERYEQQAYEEEVHNNFWDRNHIQAQSAPQCPSPPLTLAQLEATAREMAAAFGHPELIRTVPEPLPQQEATLEQMQRQWRELTPETRAPVTFADVRKPLGADKCHGVPVITNRHGAWLSKMALFRPDAFALKQKLAREAEQKPEPIKD